MADIDTITMRAAFTSQALATMAVDAEWDRRLADYLRADALQFADSEFGAYFAAGEKHSLAGIRLESRFGPAYRGNPEAKALADAAYAEVDAANTLWVKTYLEQFWEAARDLACSPAPTLAAALFKVALIHSEDLGNDGAMTRDPMQIVSEDMARLAGEQPCS